MGKGRKAFSRDGMSSHGSDGLREKDGKIRKGRKCVEGATELAELMTCAENICKRGVFLVSSPLPLSLLFVYDIIIVLLLQYFTGGYDEKRIQRSI